MPGLHAERARRPRRDLGEGLLHLPGGIAANPSVGTAKVPLGAQRADYQSRPVLATLTSADLSTEAFGFPWA